MNKSQVLGGIFGVCIGDSLGVPVEFKPRSQLKENPVKDMLGYGAHNQPPGTWSDDSSMMLCLAESLCQGFNLQDIAGRFVKWLYEAYWTPHGDAFDCGSTTAEALRQLKAGVSPVESGSRDDLSNGNGSLMRTLPLAFYLENKSLEEQLKVTHQVSAITHAHPRSQMACGLYVLAAIELLRGSSPQAAYEKMKKTAAGAYSKPPFESELPRFQRILEGDIARLDEEEIESSGYVIHTLEASLWCFLNSRSFEETVLKAVNLGHDSDTTGAVVGGLAGIYYGYGQIPQLWLNQLARKPDIHALAIRFYHSLSKQ
jgi:ADP-ribosylglycohydrolase